MAPLGPFEPAPVVAVAVSGGPDSMALALLADAWARARGGRAVSLTVDHGLRPDAADEAARVGTWLGGRGIDHRILTWTAPRPAAGIQAAARAARYRLLEDWCAANGVLHLLVAHQQEDQAETFLLRLGRGSGLYGLAAMSPIVERRRVRLLRPLLAVPRACLKATLEAHAQPWIEDPSNRDPRHARARLRAELAARGSKAPSPEVLATSAARLARGRVALETEVDRLLARAVMLRPEGYARLLPAPIAEAPADLAIRALARLLVCVGGGHYAPRLPALERLHRRLGEAGSRLSATLGGCRLLPRKGALMVCREDRNPPPPLTVEPGRMLRWDGRFAVEADKGAAGLTLAPLGAEGWAAARADLPGRPALPAPVGAVAPALWDGARLIAVPHLRYAHGAAGAKALTSCRIAFSPRNPLTGPGFHLV